MGRESDPESPVAALHDALAPVQRQGHPHCQAAEEAILEIPLRLEAHRGGGEGAAGLKGHVHLAGNRVAALELEPRGPPNIRAIAVSPDAHVRELRRRLDCPPRRVVAPAVIRLGLKQCGRQQRSRVPRNDLHSAH